MHAIGIFESVNDGIQVECLFVGIEAMSAKKEQRIVSAEDY